MVQVLILVFSVGLFTILTTIIWMITRHSFDDDHDSGDIRQGGASEPSGKGGATRTRVSAFEGRRLGAASRCR